MPIAPGTHLGQYVVQDFLGQGAMGVVYRAYHPELERTGAVKVVQAISPDPNAVVRFRHEAQAIAKLRHPNIVDVYDFGDFQGTPYMIVEYVPGGSLAARMAKGPLDRQAAIRILRGIAAGLDYAHSHGVVHRDVKPANVLLTAEESPVLADFGLAKLMQGSSLKSMTGVTTGTPAYMAPEQVTGERVGPAADRYSVATIAYEMLTGVIPFDGEGLMELLYAQVHRYPTPPSGRMPDLGPAVDAVIMRGLAKNPADRWETCAAFVDALERAMAAEPAPAPAVAPTMVMAPTVGQTRPLARKAVVADTPDATVAVAYPAVTPAPTAPLPAKRSLRPSRRRILLGLAALLALLLTFGVCAAVVAQATTLTVNPTLAARGQTVEVTATHVPAGQAGEIELHSIVHTYAFQADGQGRVRVEMTVPDDVELGDHVVKICWANSCHKDAALRVVAGPGEPLPTPSGSPSASPSASPSGTPHSSPTPGSTPRTTATPRSTTTANPTAAPKPSPTPTKPPPSPTPTSNPCPTSTSAATLTQPGSTVALSSTIPVAGQNFTPNAQVTVRYYLGGTLKATKTATVGCNGTFSTSFAAGSVLGNGSITATDGTRSASKSFTIVL